MVLFGEIPKAEFKKRGKHINGGKRLILLDNPLITSGFTEAVRLMPVSQRAAQTRFFLSLGGITWGLTVSGMGSGTCQIRELRSPGVCSMMSFEIKENG